MLREHPVSIQKSDPVGYGGRDRPACGEGRIGKRAVNPHAKQQEQHGRDGGCAFCQVLDGGDKLTDGAVGARTVMPGLDRDHSG